MVDINRGTAGVPELLPAEVSQEIIQKVEAASVVMGLARRVVLPGAGIVIPEILSDSVPEFVGETERKPVSNPTVGHKTLKGHKIAVVQTYSDEFRRDLPGLFNALLSRLPGTLAKTFDLAALHGIGAPAADFDTLADATSVPLLNTTPGSDDAYAGFLAALAAVDAGGGDLDAWALSTQAEILALSNRDTNGAPILSPNPLTTGSVGQILGRPVFRSSNAYEAGTAGDTAATVGVAGDWDYARYGVVEAVSIDISDNPVFNSDGSLVTAGWQDNMIGVRAEFHVGFLADDTKFVRLTGETPTA